MLKEEFDAMNERKDFSSLLTAGEVDQAAFFNQIFGSRDDIQPVGGVGPSESLICKTQMGKVQSSFLSVEPFAALYCLTALYLPPPDPARWPGIAPPLYWQHVLNAYMVMLPVLRQIVGLTLKEAALLCPTTVCVYGRNFAERQAVEQLYKLIRT